MLRYTHGKWPEHPGELERLQKLRDLHILDSSQEAQFDGLVQIGSHMFDVPICLITLVDATRQWFKACVGEQLGKSGDGKTSPASHD